MADMIPQIEGMTSDACTFSVGVVHGGQWVNCVASACEGEALSMAKRQAGLIVPPGQRQHPLDP